MQPRNTRPSADISELLVTPRKAIALQKEIAARIETKDRLPKKIRTVAGVDISHNFGSKTLFAACVLLDFQSLSVIETKTARMEATFPYIPGLLAFREIPPILKAYKKLKIKPDLIVVDGHGQAHPRRAGIASHLGFFLDIPTIGCAKTILIGKMEGTARDTDRRLDRKAGRLQSKRVPVKGPSREEIGARALKRAVGSTADLLYRGEVVAKVLRSIAGGKPIYISVGHRVSLGTATRLILTMLKGHHLPEPTYRAHIAANFARLDYFRRIQQLP